MKTMIIVNNGLEECEALLTYDLLYRAGIQTDLVGFEEEILSSHEVTFKAHKLLDEIDPLDYDCLILPGGMPGTLNLENDERVQKLIDLFVEKDRYIAAICAAPSILLHKGLLEHRRFVCFPGFESGKTPENAKAVKDGRFITGKGLGAAFEFSYEIIKALVNEEKAKEVLAKVQY
ncbi:MAG: DJ-1/PfpI family protein [Erysipelotrichaceae bacterium]|nr:DJ-1/PfpI family protein [Erysipelotrichaceae bacterium]